MVIRVTYFKGNDTSWIEHSNIDSVETSEGFIYLICNGKVQACYNANKILYYNCR